MNNNNQRLIRAIVDSDIPVLDNSSRTCLECFGTALTKTPAKAPAITNVLRLGEQFAQEILLHSSRVQAFSKALQSPVSPPFHFIALLLVWQLLVHAKGILNLERLAKSIKFPSSCSYELVTRHLCRVAPAASHQNSRRKSSVLHREQRTSNRGGSLHDTPRSYTASFWRSRPPSSEISPRTNSDSASRHRRIKPNHTSRFGHRDNPTTHWIFVKRARRLRLVRTTALARRFRIKNTSTILDMPPQVKYIRRRDAASTSTLPSSLGDGDHLGVENVRDLRSLLDVTCLIIMGMYLRTMKTRHRNLETLRFLEVFLAWRAASCSRDQCVMETPWREPEIDDVENVVAEQAREILGKGLIENSDNIIQTYNQIHTSMLHVTHGFGDVFKTFPFMKRVIWTDQKPKSLSTTLRKPLTLSIRFHRFFHETSQE